MKKIQKRSKDDCKQPAGIIIPIINRNKCEAKETCSAVCPFDVFDIRKVTNEEKVGLNRFIRFKIWAHGGKQAFVVRPYDCHGCGDCATSCPEKAIVLENVSSI